MNNLTNIQPTFDSPEISESNFKDSACLATCRLYKGDNLDVLEKLAQKKERFDFCYIDPPYNTKNRFMYEDTFVSVVHPIWGDNAAWMDFMLMRLEKLYGLLEEGGIVAISIDDNEQPYLRVLLDLVFGKKNFIACIAVCRSRNGKGGGRGVSVNHEYVVIYGKSESSKVVGFPDVCTASYNKSDEYGHFRLDGLFRKKGDASKRSDRPRMHYPLYYCDKGKVYVENVTGSLKEALPVDSKGVERRWIWGKDKARDESWRLYASKNGVIYVKAYHYSDKRVSVKSFWDDNRYLTERATNEIKAIFGDKAFDTPKPIALIEDIIDSMTPKDAKIIDFFAGSGTTAHAAHNLNIRDDGTRTVVLAEQERPIEPCHSAYALGYRTIADITEGRLFWVATSDSRFTYEVVSCPSRP